MHSNIITSITRAPYQSFASFLVLFFTLFLASMLFVSLSFFHGLIGYVETRPEVMVYFKTSTPESDILSFRDQLLQWEQVASVQYVSKEDAFNIYRERNQDKQTLLEMISPDILPASLEIFARNPEDLEQIATFFQTQKGVDEVVYHKSIVEKLLSLTSIMRLVSVGLFVFLFAMSTVVMITTILFKVALRKEEINLLRLIGASRFYVRKPFLWESVVFVFIASVASFMTIVGLLWYTHPFLVTYLRNIPSLYIAIGGVAVTVWPMNPWFIMLAFVSSTFFGFLIALFATHIATNKYLRA